MPLYPTIRNNSRNPIPGYNWNITVHARDKDRTNSYTLHFLERPSQEEFERHYALYVARTHYVNVAVQDAGEEYGWRTITEEFNTNLSREFIVKDEGKIVYSTEAGGDAPDESTVVSDEWPAGEGAQWRIKFWDASTDCHNYHYSAIRPTGAMLAKYHHTRKGLAVAQQRPKDES